jgi:hypothetical protein
VGIHPSHIQRWLRDKGIEPIPENAEGRLREARKQMIMAIERMQAEMGTRIRAAAAYHMAVWLSQETRPKDLLGLLSAYALLIGEPRDFIARWNPEPEITVEAPYAD